jgi:hypothetical protein
LADFVNFTLVVVAVVVSVLLTVLWFVTYIFFFLMLMWYVDPAACSEMWFILWCRFCITNQLYKKLVSLILWYRRHHIRE